MKQIPLTQGQVALVDDWRYEELNQWKWHAHWDEGTKSFYAVRKEWPSQRTIQMHRHIMNTPRDMECDHQDHNTLNNQEYNLRNVTHSQNQLNRRVRFDNKLGQRCISQQRNGYRVRIFREHKEVFCKTFGSLDDAILARDEAIKKYHGEFAYL